MRLRSATPRRTTSSTAASALDTSWVTYESLASWPSCPTIGMVGPSRTAYPCVNHGRGDVQVTGVNRYGDPGHLPGGICVLELTRIRPHQQGQRTLPIGIPWRQIKGAVHANAVRPPVMNDLLPNLRKPWRRVGKRRQLSDATGFQRPQKHVWRAFGRLTQRQ